MARKLYGREENGKFYLSPLPFDVSHSPVKPRAANVYATQNEAIHAAEARGAEIEWLP